jgi:hypothetical protein
MIMNKLGEATERIMAMNDVAWERHANPWSGWTRVATMPLLTLAIWSRVWIGWWSLVPISLVIVWTWINPRLFPPPASLDHWMSRGVLGERIWLADTEGSLAQHHRTVIRATTLIAGSGALVWLGGLIWLDLTATLSGLTASMLGKLWFIDRMVWIQREQAEVCSQDHE